MLRTPTDITTVLRRWRMSQHPEPSPRACELGSSVWSIPRVRGSILKYVNFRVFGSTMIELLTLDKRTFPDAVLALYSGIHAPAIALFGPNIPSVRDLKKLDRPRELSC